VSHEAASASASSSPSPPATEKHGLSEQTTPTRHKSFSTMVTQQNLQGAACREASTPVVRRQRSSCTNPKDQGATCRNSSTLTASPFAPPTVPLGGPIFTMTSAASWRAAAAQTRYWAPGSDSCFCSKKEKQAPSLARTLMLRPSFGMSSFGLSAVAFSRRSAARQQRKTTSRRGRRS
jgi:hypothetical protein